MDRKSIYNYVKLYKQILNRHRIYLDERDLSNIYHLIMLVFQLDDLYDRIEQYPPSQDRLSDLKTAMTTLMPNDSPIRLKAIALVFQAMQDESLLKAKDLTLQQYLKVTSQSIGAPIISGYLASKIQLKPDIWYGDLLVAYNSEINTLIRLANDLLDVGVDRNRSVKEKSQLKAIFFFANKHHLESYFLYRSMPYP